MILAVEARHQLKMYVRSDANDAMERICAKHGMTKQEAASRVFEWFAGQSGIVQAAVLGHLPEEDAPDIARVVLAKMAKQTPPNRPKPPSKD